MEGLVSGKLNNNHQKQEAPVLINDWTTRSGRTNSSTTSNNSSSIMKPADPISFADAAFERRGLHDFFTPLTLSTLPQKQLQPISKNPKTTKKKERSRSIQFADEKQEAQFMLETILLFESDDCFGDSSVVEAVMEDFHHDSFSSFDGECYDDYAAAQPVSSDDDDEDDSVESAPLTWKELEQEVREQQAREFRERNDSGSSMVLENPSNAGEITDTNKSKGGGEVPNDILVSGNADNKETPCEVRKKKKKKNAKNKSPSPTSSPKREIDQARKVSLQKALEKSTSLRMLDENGKARKAREKERLKGQKELAEKQAREEQERLKRQQESAEAKPKPVRRAPKRTKSAMNRVKKEQQQEGKLPQLEAQELEQKEQGLEHPKKPQPVRRAPKRTKSALNRLKKNNSEVPENERQQPRQAQQLEPEKDEAGHIQDERPQNPQPVRRAPKRTKSSSNRIKRTETDSVLPTHSRRASIGALPNGKVASGSKLQRTNTDPVSGSHNGVRYNKALKDFDFPKSSVASAAARWGKRSSSVESSSQQEVLSAQQKRMNELKVCSTFQSPNEGMMSSSAQYAESAYQRRQRELGAVRRSSIVGGNLLNKRERLVVILQAAARGYLVRTQVDRHCHFDAAIQVQALWRGYDARKCIAEARAKITAMERHLEETARATENAVASIFNSPELQSLQDLLNDANLNARQRALEKEKLKIKNDSLCVKNDTSQVKQYMENQKVNNKNVAKSTREIEWQCSQLKDRIASLHKEEQYLISKKEQAEAKLTNMKAAISELECRAKMEHAVGKISHRTILEIRDHTKEVAQTSQDPFLTKVNTRSKILDRVRLGKKLGKAGIVRPTVISR